ncbi:ComEC/Rec2 family competence protein [Streptomyces palmae]|uniref:ComEC/Rec2 family competence protein n=1 Tax=Streptomyces palmae TaxID=1701085 RepID=UPI001432CDDB|nr:ComEC/Rec2 family competence protein [Streptomyces palmae]
MHAAADSPLGASNPHREGPTDLRLVPPALAAWGAAALALGAPGAVTATVCAGAVVLALALLWQVRRGGSTAPSASVRAPGRRRGGNLAAIAMTLLCAAAAATVAGLHTAELRRGPVPELAGRSAVATVDLTVTSDPRRVATQPRGAAPAASVVVLSAEATRVTAAPGPRGAGAIVRTPVLVTVRPRTPTAAASWLRLLPSTRLRVVARLSPPMRSVEPFAAVLRVRGGGAPEATGAPSAPQRVAGRLREGLRTATEGLGPDARALLPGLVVGDTSRVPAELDKAFRATDLTHLLAVSGSNLTLLLALLIGPPHLAHRSERRGLAARLGIPLRGTALLGGALTLAFVVVCRPEPSVLRAAACGLIALLAIGTGRRRSLLPALAAAVLALVLYDPWLARSYGFLLSVLATGSLLTLAPVWSVALRRRGVPPRLAEVLAAGAAAQAVCAPVVVVLAARVSLVGIPCNLLAECAVGPATVLGFAALATAPLAMPVAKALAWLAAWPTEWLATVARTGAGLPGAEVGWPGGWGGGLLLAAVTAAAVPLVRRLPGRPWVSLVCVILLLAVVLRPPPLIRVVTGWPPPGWRMVACDVGQGDALVLAAGRGTAVVVDTGPEPGAVDRCLRVLGVRRIPLLVLTHFHADHVAGLAGVLHGRAVGAIETTTLAEPAEQAAYVRRQAAAAGIPLVVAVPGERRSVGPLSWEVLWPPSPTRPPSAGHSTGMVPPSSPSGGASAGVEPSDGAPLEGPNDASVTLLVRSAGLSLLLLGDLEPAAQQALLAACPELPPVDVLKVAHHGSAYQDPGLLHRLRPRLAVISAGAHNPYGHPAPRTIAVLRHQRVAVVRTDTDGSVAVLGSGPGLRAVVRGSRRRRAGRHPRCGVARRQACAARAIRTSCTPPPSAPPTPPTPPAPSTRPAPPAPSTRPVRPRQPTRPAPPAQHARPGSSTPARTVRAARIVRVGFRGVASTESAPFRGLSPLGGVVRLGRRWGKRRSGEES